jgi:hypothetical protein
MRKGPGSEPVGRFVSHVTCVKFIKEHKNNNIYSCYTAKYNKAEVELPMSYYRQEPSE